MKTGTDPLGDRMKFYEGQFGGGGRFMPLIPVCARIDGRCFSSFTRGMARPFDRAMSLCMAQTTKALVEETNANIGYTQSDEITLAWFSGDPKTQLWFDGRIAKMTSQLAAIATLHFYRAIQGRLPAFAERLPVFDARVWQVPNLDEAANVFVWREWDATKNSITMAASEYFSHRELQNKSGKEKQEMLFQKGVNWNDYPTHFKRGIYIQRRVSREAFTAEEIDKLPPKHNARKNPDLVFERSTIEQIEMPKITSVSNRVGVLFLGETPR